MANTIKGHLLKYRLEDGTWVTLPMSVINVYDIYKLYCLENGIEEKDIMSEYEYYVVLGNIRKYAEDLAGSAAGLQPLIEAIGEGALPVSKGGTGYTDEQQLLQHYASQLVNVYTIATTQHVHDELLNMETILNDAIEAHRAEFAHGDKEPAAAGLSADVKYYFQIV